MTGIGILMMFTGACCADTTGPAFLTVVVLMIAGAVVGTAARMGRAKRKRDKRERRRL